MRRFAQLLLVVALSLGGQAWARPMRFFGPHPVAAQLGGGYCYIEGPHLHAYAPDHGSLYARVDGALVFAGDPTPFGFEGPRYNYYGPHPLPGFGGDTVYCYLDGPHVHPFEPPSDAAWRTQHGVTFYVGPFTPLYYKERPVRARAYRTIYQPYEAMRPTVTVAPPPEWQGEVWVASPVPPPVGVGVTVGVPPPPGARVSVTVPPPPRVDVRIGVPPPPHVIVAPPPPPRVVVAPPPVIVAPLPPPRVVVAPPAPGAVLIEGHDRGKHKGWYKEEDEGWKHGNGKWKGHGRGHD